jgi:hypothetical protein
LKKRRGAFYYFEKLQVLLEEERTKVIPTFPHRLIILSSLEVCIWQAEPDQVEERRRTELLQGKEVS